MIHKKASLDLSIQAIVIVVIAFVFLGIGLQFVRSQIGDIQKTSTAVQEQISQQILDDLRTGNKKLSFPASKLTVETGEESVQAIGIKNTGDSSADLTIEFSVKDAEGGFKEFTSGNDIIFSTKDGEATAGILWDNSLQTLKPGESRVIAVTIKAPDKIGNYLYKVVLKEDGVAEPYDQKTFFIKTS